MESAESFFGKEIRGMIAAVHERLFEPFLDEVDGILCVPAKSTSEEIEDRASVQGLRFPLCLDVNTPLCDQIAASSHAPASSRFGPFLDNITGMNWELPDGRRVRLGERVVKSTTGYDLLRFLLGTGNRFGRPIDHVLRLRPACDWERRAFFKGERRALKAAASEIVHSSFLHWLESVDWLENGKDESPSLRIDAHTESSEASIFYDFLSGVAERQAVRVEFQNTGDGKPDGCPDLVLKTSPDQVIELAEKAASLHPVRCVALCYCAVTHVYLPPESDPAIDVPRIAEPLADGLHARGGDWHSRHIQTPPSNDEKEWVEVLAREWGAGP